MPNSHAKTATLTMQGTCTRYQPTGYLSHYLTNRLAEEPSLNQSETLSFLVACMKKPRLPESLPISTDAMNALIEKCPAFKTTTTHISTDGDSEVILSDPLNTRLIEGPDFFGRLVYKKIAEGTASLLGSILEGRNNLNIQGHSRGGIEALLIAHELDRIKQTLRNNNTIDATDLYAILCNSPISQIKKELEQLLDPIKADSDTLNAIATAFRDTKTNNNIRVNLCLADPVPGNGVAYQHYMDWHDARYFTIPPIVRHAQITLCENEDSAGFDPVLPIVQDKTFTTLTACRIPGHHGTLMGNPLGNNGETLASLGVAEGTAADVQIVTLYEHYDFLEANGASFMAQRNKSYPLTEIYNTYYHANKKERASLRLNAYDRIKANQHVYSALNSTVYSWHTTFSYPYAQPSNTRQVMHDGIISGLTTLIPFQSDHFVNAQHVKLFLMVHLGIESSHSLPLQIVTLLTGLDNPVEQTRLIHALGEQGENLAIVQDSIQATVSKFIQLYLENNLDSETKRQTLFAINKALSLTIVPLGTPDDEPVETQTLTIPEQLKAQLKNHLHDYLLDMIKKQIDAHLRDLTSMVLSMQTRDESVAENKFFHNSLLKYQQFKTFKVHLSDLQQTITECPLKKALSREMAKLQMACDSTVLFCAQAIQANELSLASLVPKEAELSEDELAFTTQLQPLLDGLSGIAQQCRKSAGKEQQTIARQAEMLFDQNRQLQFHRRTHTQDHEIIRQQTNKIEELLSEKQSNAQQIGAIYDTLQKYGDTINDQSAANQDLRGRLYRANEIIGGHRQHLEQAQEHSHFLGMSGISLQIVSGFMAVLGATAVTLAIAALIAGMVSVAPAAIGITIGVTLTTIGMFGVSSGAKGNAYAEAHHTFFPNMV